jgi:plastocyanin
MKRFSNRLTQLALLVTIALSAAALSACGPFAFGPCTPKGGGNGSATSTVQVVADANKVGTYQPENVTIQSGQSVTWAWQDQSNQHSVTADDGSFDSCLQKAGSSFTVTFAKAGTYGYKCSIHPQMIGRVTVT